MPSLLWGVSSFWGHCWCPTVNESLPASSGGSQGHHQAPSMHRTAAQGRIVALNVRSTEVEKAAPA